MTNVEHPAQYSEAQYTAAIAEEGEYWDSFVVQRLLRGEMPGSIDWRINFSQFRYNHRWLPFCLGPQGINFRLHEIRYILALAARRPGLRILDLGCGAGWLSLELARLGAHVTAVDISPTNLALGRYMVETNARNFPFLYQNFAGLPCWLEAFGSVEHVHGDLNTVNLPHGAYDAVVVWDSLHHVAALERLLDQVRAALKPEGVFIGVDHAFATPKTEDFNRAVLPWLDDFYAWVTTNDPQWIYEQVSTVSRQYDWGVLAVDYDPTPLEGFGPFIDQLLAEMLDITRSSLRQEALAKAEAQAQIAPQPGEAVAESPFEDVSAERVIAVLLESFHTERFTTICPLIMPEKHIPHYRTEAERIFQHYLAAGLIRFGEHAVARGQADGQWFLFHLTPAASSQAQPQLRAPQTAAGLERHDAARMTTEFFNQKGYITHLEAEIVRKNAALLDLETRLRRREQELLAARAPRLPWKKRKPPG